MKKTTAILLCIVLLLGLCSCVKVTTTYIKKPADTSSVTSSSSEVQTSSESSSEQQTSSSESSSQTSSEVTEEDIQQADDTVNAVLKEAATFTGVYPDEKNYRIYYIDSENGNDDNDGRTPEKAWKSLSHVNYDVFEPGTKILLKRGSVFNEQLVPASSGEEGKYFIIDAYGEGDKPVINGGGESAAVIISNKEYIEIRNLEITNTSMFDGDLNGVLVMSGGQISSTEYREGGMVNHVYLINLDIHDVTCSEGNRFRAGILFYSYLSKNPSAFTDILVQGCTIRNTGGSGITMASDYEYGPGVEWSTGPYYPSQNVCFRDNFIENCASDGIFQSAANNVLIEYNRVTNTSYAQGAYAGIWPHYSSNVVMQYNESYANRLVGGDGQGFDVDINCENVVVQYNYSHDNEGGFILICTDGSTGKAWNRDVTVRYNISQNDLGQIFTLSGPISDVKIYNNTVYTKSGLTTNLVGSYDWGSGQSPSSVRFSNNLFYMNTTGYSSLIIPSRLTFTNNLFFGTYDYSNLPAVNTVTSDPLLKAPGTGELGIDTLGGYVLKKGSPCINAGVELSENAKIDFFGNKIAADGKTDIGAAEFTK